MEDPKGAVRDAGDGLWNPKGEVRPNKAGPEPDQGLEPHGAPRAGLGHLWDPLGTAGGARTEPAQGARPEATPPLPLAPPRRARHPVGVAGGGRGPMGGRGGGAGPAPRSAPRV